MVNRSPWRIAVLLLGLWLAPVLPASAGITSDPTGDTFNSGAIDLIGTEIVPGSPNFVITLQFASAVVAPSDAMPNSLTGFIDLDTDSNPATGGDAPWGGPVPGGNNWINFYISTGEIPAPHDTLLNLGSEYFIDLGSQLINAFFGQPTIVDVVSTATNLAVNDNVNYTGPQATIAYNGTTVTITLPSVLIGNAGGLNYGVVVGDFNSATDRAPNGANPIAAVPEPGTMVLAGFFGFGALAYRLRRRRAA